MPTVRLGRLEDGSVAPAVFALVERGLGRRPRAALELRGEAELRFTDGHPPVRIGFGDGDVVVEDGAARAPEVAIEGALPDLVGLTVTPLVGGVPNPARPRGRAALCVLARGRVRIEGSRAAGRRLLALLAVEG